MQEKYWKYMVQIKAWIFYLDVYTEDSYRWDRIINIVVAIASSTSIAAWAIWKKYSFVWSIIIAISQVLTTIKGFLPYSKRLKMLVPFMEDLKLIVLDNIWDLGKRTNDYLKQIKKDAIKKVKKSH